MGSRSSGRPRVRVFAAVLGAIAIVPASASAQDRPPPSSLGYDTIVKSTVIAVPPGNSGSGVATCPAGTRVVGGGVTTNSPTPEGFVRYRVQLSGPLDETGLTVNTGDGDVARSWYAALANEDLGAGHLFKVSALCSRTSDAIIEATDVEVGRDTADPPQGAGAATCPAGTRVVGGGVGSMGRSPTGVRVLYQTRLSGPVDETGLTANTDDNDVARGWFGFVSSEGEVEFKVMALCSRAADATVTATELTLGAFGGRAAAAVCPAGARVLGGGVGSTGPTLGEFPYQVQVSGPLDETGDSGSTLDGDVARRWFGYVHNGSGASQLFKVFALCTGERSGGGPGGGGPGGGGGGGGTLGGTSGGGSGKPLRCGGKRATIVGTNGRDRIRGTRRSDVIVALRGNDRIAGGRGNDRVCAGSGKDTVAGDSGSDRLLGEGDQDSLKGGSGNDALDGGRGADLLLAGSGNDRLLGGTGNDLLEGASGRDRMAGQSGRDTCLGGSGKDKGKCERGR